LPASSSHLQRVEWINKRDAAKRLDVSARTILAMAQAGTIQSKRERDPESNQVVVLLHAGDIERALYEREHPSKEVVKAPAPKAVQVVQLPAPPTPQALRPWLTLDEAASFSGLTKRWLLTIAESETGAISVRDMGKHAPGGRWRFHRGDLEKA
jgi:hypothetical protein